MNFMFEWQEQYLTSERSERVRYSKHPHIRTHFSGLRLIVFLFEGCLVRNQPESVLKVFLKLVSEILQTIYYWRFN